ncbi:MAG: 1-deoxy-D-xylulose-5-phosphate reductoisomerase [Deltaproteobacteria bacterium]|nr:1-deoxy-D-xylulose-5-phosphate reductoisomerase [Deltaproteobacteria bacterium]
MKTLSILGSTGSIGRSTLDIVRMHPDKFRVAVLTAGRNIDLLKRQIYEFKPEVVSVIDKETAGTLGKNLSCRVLYGEDGFEYAATFKFVDLVVSAIVGAAGLLPTLAAINAGKDVALANKETLVMAGALVMEAVKKNKATLLPIDSEHSAIFQSIIGHQKGDIKRLILTASGGPFLNTSLGKLSKVTCDEALKHPNWQMGQKVTIDSATLMNKGLEVIEARWLFDIPPERIAVHVHPQSIIHSMVEYIDGGILAQMGSADMKCPISYALAYPERIEAGVTPLNLCKLGSLTFVEPDVKRFPALKLAYESLRLGGTMPAVMNAADEIAVDAFLKKEIRFTDIVGIVENTMNRHNPSRADTIDEILEADIWARHEAKRQIEALCSENTSYTL